MNRERVAKLLRELSRVHAELADVIDGEQGAPANDAPPMMRKPRARAFPPPLRHVSDTDKMRARKILQRRGMGT